MNPEPIENAPPSSGFAKLLATGLIGWLIGYIALVIVGWFGAKSETLSVASMWAISYWWIAFAFGAVLMIVHGLVARIPSATALMAYLLPVALLAGVSGVLTAIYPDSGFRSDLFGYMALVLIFYILGFLWMTIARGGGGNTVFLRLVLPAIIGGLVVVGLLAVPAFTSNLFIYRNAFNLAISGASTADKVMLVEGTLEIRKPGKYGFSAPRYFYGGEGGMSETEPALEYGKITWGKGEPKEGVPGTYPFQIRWQKNIPSTPSRPPSEEGEREMISLEVTDAAVSTEEPVYNITADLPIARQ